jgi:hypothetical protein
MFLQVIQGKVRDQSGLKENLDRWLAELSPGADGWRGTTWGLHGDNSFIALVRFESADAARRNSDRPEQGQWWSRMASSLDREASFADYDDVIVMGPGGSDDAGFVQVMQGRVKDVQREREMTARFASAPMDFRPDIIGGLAGFANDGTFAQAIYFTSEAEAREGEQKPMPPAMQAMMKQSQANTVELNFIDLTAPAFASPT